MSDDEVYMGKNYHLCCGGCEGYLIHKTGSIYLCRNCQRVLYIPKDDFNQLKSEVQQKKRERRQRRSAD